MDESRVEGYAQIKKLLGDDSVFGINMGTDGPDQKKSILGYDSVTGKEFFAKLSTTERAMALSRNEIKVYQDLKDTGLVPKLHSFYDAEDFVFMRCECIKGKHLHGQIDIHDVLEILLLLKQMHYDHDISNTSLNTCFAHMDFCPWNMLDVNGKLYVVDWEMASEMPLGFDLFTYLLQTHFLTVNEMTGKEIIDNNETIINKYFGTTRLGWQPYLDAFVDYKMDVLSGLNDGILDKYKEMKTKC